MAWYIIIGWVVYTVSAHLHDDIFPKNNDLLSAVLYSTRITRENGRRHFLPQLLCDAIWNRWPNNYISQYLVTTIISAAYGN